MLAAAQRIRHRGDFAATVRGGRRASSGSLVVHLASLAHPVSPDAAVQTPRAGFVVPKAVGGAVVRNTVRRRLRQLVRERLVSLPEGTMLVVRALPGAAAAAYPQLASDLDTALAAARAPRRPRTSEGVR